MAFVPTFPTQPLRGLGAYPTQPLRGLGAYPTQPLRGLGALSPQQQRAQQQLRPLMMQMQSGLDDLVNQARKRSAEIVAAVKSDWFIWLQASLNAWTSKAEVYRAADEWASNIVNYAESVRKTLSAVDASGFPFYVRQPEAAQRLLRVAKDDLNEFIADFGSAASSKTFKEVVTSILETLLGFLMQIAQIVVVAFGSALAQFPVGGIALTAVAAAVIWFKFFR